MSDSLLAAKQKAEITYNALGSGFRWTIDQLGADLESVRREALAALSAAGIDRVGTNVIYGLARRSSEDAA